jgi:hypothetical protein
LHPVEGQEQNSQAEQDVERDLDQVEAVQDGGSAAVVSLLVAQQSQVEDGGGEGEVEQVDEEEPALGEVVLAAQVDQGQEVEARQDQA